MAKLTAKKRDKMKASTFAIPSERKFPIPDASHARNALARAADATPAVRAKVRAAVAKKFPGITQTKGKQAKGK